MIIDYGNGNLAYYTAAAPYYWTNNLDQTEVGVIRGSRFVDPDLFFHGLIEGGDIGIVDVPRVAIVSPIIGAKALYSNFDRLHTPFDVSAQSVAAVRNYKSLNLDSGL